jgi:hypothetical protein
MRKFFLLTAAALLATALIPADSFAAKKKGSAAAAAPRSFNSCVELAKSRGFTYSDLMEGTKAQVRQFVINCMNGRQM